MSVTTVPIRPIKKGSLTKLWIGLALVLVVAAALAFVGTQDAVTTGASNEQFLENNADEDGVITTASGLQYKVLKPGEGPSPTATDTALVKYKGTTATGMFLTKTSRHQCLLAVWFPVFPKPCS